MPCLFALHSDTVDAAALAMTFFEEQSKVEKASREQLDEPDWMIKEIDSFLAT